MSLCLLVTLFHASFNATGLLLPVANNLTDTNMSLRGIISLLEVVAAAIVVIYAGAQNLSRTQPKHVQE